MKKTGIETAAVCYESKKLFYRANKDGNKGIAFVKNGEVQFFIPMDELIEVIKTGPAITI